MSEEILVNVTPRETRVAVIENGTRAEEIRAFGVLGELSEIIVRAGIQGPALLVIGEVVKVARGQSRASEARPEKLSALAGGAFEDGKKDSRVRPENDTLSRATTAPSLSDLWRMFS